jgi:ribosomal protein S21
MAVNIEVERQDGENTLNMIRRFSKRVQGAGIINRIRGIRYYSAKPSKFVERKKALKSIRRREEIQELIKLGKMVERPARGGRR